MGARIAAVSVLTVSLWISGCAPAQETTPAIDPAAEAQTIRERSAQWMQWSQAKDAKAIAEGIFLQDATTIFDGEVHNGRAAILANAESGNAENPDSTIAWTTTHVHVAGSGDLAYERGSWTYDPDGAGEKPEENGEYVTVWRKVDGTWRVAVDAGTTIKPQE